MFELHISGLGWVVAGLVTGGILSAGYLLGFCDAKAKAIAKLRNII